MDNMSENLGERDFPKIGILVKGAELVFITGAGISAESGIKTFRDHDGLWEEYNIYDVATPEAWARNPELVTRFYNQRRKQLLHEVAPNDAHKAIADLQQRFSTTVITQNVDDLHERAGSQNVLHLHGELLKVRSSVDANLIYKCEDWEVKMGDVCEKGSQLRPHVVWFGEMVPMIEPAAEKVAQADLVVVVGTSLQVYPAAGLVQYAAAGVPIIVIDPGEMDLQAIPRAKHIRAKATRGMKLLKDKLLKTSDDGLA